MDKEIIIELLKEANQIIQKYENRYIDGEERETLQFGLLEILDQLESIQINLTDELTEINNNLDSLPKNEYTFHRELNGLIIKIKSFLKR